MTKRLASIDLEDFAETVRFWSLQISLEVDGTKYRLVRAKTALPTVGNNIFVHAGIDEEAEDLWEWGTGDFTFTEKYPAQTGYFYGNWEIVAGHVGTSVISGDP